MNPQSTHVKETILAIFFPLWFALAIGALLFYRRQDPAFRKRWHRHVYGANFALVGGAVILMTIPDWAAFLVFTVFVLFLLWVGIFRTRVCLGCGKIAQPDKIIIPARFCSKCGTALD